MPQPPRGLKPQKSTYEGVSKQIEGALAKRTRLRLGLKDTDALPVEIANNIKAQADKSAKETIQNAIQRDAKTVATDIERVALFDRFVTQASLASVGLKQIAGSPDIAEILKQRAEMLEMKMTALTTANFTRDEAMRILLADIAARS